MTRVWGYWLKLVSPADCADVRRSLFCAYLRDLLRAEGIASRKEPLRGEKRIHAPINLIEIEPVPGWEPIDFRNGRLLKERGHGCSTADMQFHVPYRIDRSYPRLPLQPLLIKSSMQWLCLAELHRLLRRRPECWLRLENPVTFPSNTSQ